VLTFGVAPPTGVAVEAITHTVLDISAAASSVLIDEFTGDGSDTTFTLSAAPANENNTQVYVGGVYQEKATYSVSGTTLTFSEAPANGVSIEVMSIAVGQINSAIQLSDADGDTKVMVEESSDEDKIRFDTGGTERAIIDSTGLGVGTSSPAEKLEVAGNIFVNTSGNPNLTVKTSGAGNNPYVRIQADTNYWDLQTLFSNANDELDFRYNGTSTLKIDNAGHVTKPSQPAVRVGMSSSQLNLAANTEYVIQFNSEVFDVNGDFNTSDYTFTAPVTGKYLVCVSLRFQGLPTNINYMHGWIASSNGNRFIILFGSGTDLFNSDVDYYRAGGSTIIDMDANDTFTIKVAQSGGNAYTDIGQESDLSIALLS
jgi:hypothetical protein